VAIFFSLMTHSEEMDMHLREIDRLSRRYESLSSPDDRDEIGKAINQHLREVLKHKDRVLKKVDKEIRKVEKRAVRLEKKAARAEKKGKDASAIRKELARSLEEIDALKSEAAERIPRSLLSMAFVESSLQTGEEYFSVDLRNFVGDLYLVGDPRRRRYDRIKIRSAELYTNGERCSNFDVLCNGQSYNSHAIKGLDLRLKKGDTAVLRVYAAFSEGMNLRFVIDTENFGPLSFEKTFKTAH